MKSEKQQFSASSKPAVETQFLVGPSSKPAFKILTKQLSFVVGTKHSSNHNTKRPLTVIV